MEHLTFTDYASRNAAFDDENLTSVKCPQCGEVMAMQRWVNQGDRRYMNLASCTEHGNYLVRVKLRFTEEETWSANRILYEADEGMAEFYKTKSVQCRKRSRRRKKKAAETQ